VGNKGIDGHVVKVEILDDAGDAGKAPSIVQDAVQNKGVEAMVSVSGTESSWGAYAKDKNIPVIGGNTFTATWTSNPMFFPISTTIAYVIYAVESAAKDLGASSFGDMYDPGVPSAAGAVPIYQSTAPRIPIKWAGAWAAATNSPDFTAACVSAQQDKADSMIAAYAATAIPHVASDCARQSYHPKFIIADGQLTNALLDVSDLDGSGGPVFGFPWSVKAPETKQFQAAMKKYAPHLVYGDPAAIMWLALTAFDTAATGHLATTPSNQDILNGLWSFNGETLGGLEASALTFKQGTNAPDNKCWFTMQIKSKKYVAPKGFTPSCATT
jgi:branched-chain amino acid transport system substrate-binding protein